MYPLDWAEPPYPPPAANEFKCIHDTKGMEKSVRSSYPIAITAKSDDRNFAGFDQHASISSRSCTDESEEEYREADERQEISGGGAVLRGPGLLLAR